MQLKWCLWGKMLTSLRGASLTPFLTYPIIPENDAPLELVRPQVDLCKGRIEVILGILLVAEVSIDDLLGSVHVHKSQSSHCGEKWWQFVYPVVGQLQGLESSQVPQ